MAARLIRWQIPSTRIRQESPSPVRYRPALVEQNVLLGIRFGAKPSQHAELVPNPPTVTASVTARRHSLRTGNDFNNDLDKWRVGVTLDYAITEGLAARISVPYNQEDLTATTDRDYVSGFVRLQRNF
ncbi:porin [Ensifer sp. ENS10]|uniref:porin n=1 Tax=Ensifer sp. ENS10 TaxID=2769286 RepID=UPI0017839B70|nr:porin [Ensifer sp. ENS10]MBD9511332.1 porin [Ensifer sp. ENS10]